MFTSQLSAHPRLRRGDPLVLTQISRHPSPPPHPPKPHAKPQRAFTLVELLVVLGIIAVLIGILLPTLSRTREHSKALLCQTRLRSLGQALYAYLPVNNGYGCITAYTLPKDAVTPGYSLTSLYWGYRLDYPSSGPSVFTGHAGYLTPYYKKPEIFDCPVTEDLINSTVLPSDYKVSYAYNNNTLSNAVRKFSMIRNGAETFALVDSATVGSIGGTGGPTGIILQYASNAPSTSSLILSFHGRHRGKGNVLWYDGHVTSETPYIPTEASGLSASSAMWAKKANIGVLTPYSLATAPEPSLKQKPDAAYYYWISKKNMK